MYNVLIADDEQSICEGLSTIINWNAYGFHVSGTASDGEEALAMLNETEYNLVVTDIRMPVMDGLELVKHISLSYPYIKSVIISGYNDFNYAKKAIEYGVNGYILKPIDPNELIQCILYIKKSLDNEFETKKLKIENLFLNFIRGNIDYPSFQEKLGSCGFDLEGEFIRVAIIEIDNFYSMIANDLNSASDVKNTVKSITSQILEENKSGFIYEDVDGTIDIIFTGPKAELNDEHILKLLEKIISGIAACSEIKVTIGYGQTAAISAQPKTSYNQARQALASKCYMDTGKAVTLSDEFFAENTIINIAWDKQPLLLAIEEYDPDKIKSEILILIEEIKNKRFTSDIINFCFRNILFEIVHLLRKYDNADSISFIHQKISMIESRDFSIDQLYELLYSICCDVSNLMTKPPKNTHQSIIHQIEKYVQEHFSEDLNLKAIASIFYMNPVYLGRLFKNTLGINFIDYINKVRIAEVKKMLLSEEYKIFEIIEHAGYNNQEYFYKVFRKYEGVSFAEYKEKMKL